MKKYFSQKRLGIFFCMILALVCLSYGCGGGARDIILVENGAVYTSGDVDNEGKIYLTLQSEPIVIIEAKEGGTLPENSSLTLKERDLEASEVWDYGSVSTKAYTLTGAVEKGGVIRPLTETMKPITITIPNRFSSEYTEFWLGFKRADDMVWQYQKLSDKGSAVVMTARMSNSIKEFVISTYRLNYVFTVFACKPEELIKERVESFYLTAEPMKYEYVASEGVNLFCDDLRISSLITANDAYVFDSPNVVHELTFVSDSNQGSGFKIDGERANEQISVSPESSSKYIHKFAIDKYLPDNCKISGLLATFSFVLNIKGASLEALPDNFKIKTTVTTHKNTLFTYEEAFFRIRNVPSEPEYCEVTMIEPNPVENVATNTRIVLSFEKEIQWKSAFTSYIKLYDENNEIASVTCFASEDQKEIIVVPVNGLRYENTYTLALRKGIPAVDPNYALNSGNFQFITIPASFTMATITATEDSFYLEHYKTNPSFIIDFVKPVANIVEAQNAIKVTSPDGPVLFSLSFNPENTIATLTFLNDLKPETHYSIIMSKTVKDIENVDIAQFGVLNFTTIPNVLAELKTPVDASNASVDTEIIVRFTPPVDWDEHCENLISLVNADNRSFDFNCDYASSTGMLTIIPLADLQYNMNYAVAFEGGMINHESHQKLDACRLPFKTNNKVPGTDTEPERFVASISVVTEDYVDADAVPPFVKVGARFTIDFIDTPQELHQAENAIMVYGSNGSITKLSAEWNEDKTRLTFAIPKDVYAEVITIRYVDEVIDSRNVPIVPFVESKFEILAFEGEGTEESPYLVSTAKQLDMVRRNLTAHYKQVSDIDFTDYISTVTANYEVFGFEPIGCLSMDNIKEYWSSGDSSIIESLSFSGVYDGGNNKIKGFWQDSPEERATVGLFGSVAGSDSEIRNVNLDNPNGCIKGSGYVGAICSSISYGKIINCSNNIPIECSYAPSFIEMSMYTYIGGITAMCGGIVDNCRNNGNITGTNQIDTAGGIVGCSGGIISDSPGFTISNCANTGDITTAGGNLAGIAANAFKDNCSIINCVNNGNISCNNTSISNNYAVGIIANTNTGCKIISCVNTGNTIGAYAAGLCGNLYYSEVSNCYTEGSVTVKNNEPVENYDFYAGAITACLDSDSTIKDCFATKNTVVNGEAVSANSIYGHPDYYGGDLSNVTCSYILNNGYEDEIRTTTWSGEATWLDASKWILRTDRLPELVLPTE